MSKHTPGPWNVDDDDLIFAPAIDDYVATVVTHDSRGRLIKSCDANAKLLAAAPDLLNALTWLMFADNGPAYDNAMENARCAVAKATGGKP